MKSVAVLVAALALSSLGGPTWANEGGTSVEATESRHRLALVIGANQGGGDREVLRYAVTDANAFARVLADLGGVHPDDALFLSEPNRQQVMDGIGQLAHRASLAHAEGKYVEAIIYYSGHSNEEGLLLNGEVVGYPELKAAITGIAADVRITVLDSCASGALIRTKGGTRRAPFMVDAANLVRGVAFLTSSSADEVAQESDRLGGSFFTHHLVAALRGAADLNADGRVTLNEAYQYSYQETLARTEKTQAGPQHANYAIEMAGQGDVVLTDIEQSPSHLVLHESLNGRLAIRDHNEKLVVELKKGAGTALTLALSEGNYQVFRRVKEEASLATITLKSGVTTTLALGDFQAMGDLPRHASRGDEAPAKVAAATDVAKKAPASEPSAAPEPSGPEPVVVPLTLSLFHNVGLTGYRTDVIVRGFALNFVHGTHQRLDGFALGLLGNFLTDELNGLQLTPGMNLVWGRARGAQVAAGLNVVRDDLHGGQLSAGGNFVGGKSHWIQVAAGGNYATQMDGVQVGALGNYVHENARGVQLAAAGNVVMGDVFGAQIAVGNNTAASFTGLQWAVGNNVAWKGQGLQASVINVAREIRGFQLGLVNVAAEVHGESFGLINVIGNGYHAAEFYADDTAPVGLGVKSGSKHLYSLASVALDPFQVDPTIHFGLGFGWHQRLWEALSLDVDAQALSPKTRMDFSNLVNREGGAFDVRLRTLPRWNFWKHFAVFGGPVMNLAFAIGDPEVAGVSYAPRLWNLARNDIFNLDMGLGGAVGISVPF
jgi:hypothetical protein